MKLTDYFGDWLKGIDVPKLAKVVTILHFMLELVLLCLIKYSLRSVNKRNSTLQAAKVQKTGFADKTCVTNDKKDLSR